MIRHPRDRPVWPHWPLLLLVILVVLPGCVRREGRNSDCQWPRTSELKESGANQRDLRADLEFAEELAIRYMDAHYGPSNPEAAAQAKNRCMGILLGEIGKKHGITAQEAFKFFGQRGAAVDLAMNLPFILFYALAADFLIRRLLGRYPPSEGWMTSIIMIILASVAFGTGGLMLGQQWSGLAESIRIGTRHLSNRGLRLPISKHPSEAFLFGVALFLSIAVLRYWGKRNAPVAG
ncbi:MAG: hypothetical protein DMG09_17800 [Acidobacteria bacterium]|nr:MAG: hypothetical protein DMG09_17800 [Acidobacteriota bacterium]